MSDADVSLDNQVFLRGRLAEPPATKELPSGDLLTVFRLTVDRPADDRVRVDSLECVTTKARPRRTLQHASPGDVLEVSGSLRRRFWRGSNGLASRYAVEVVTARVSRRSGPAPAAVARVTDRTAVLSRDRKPASG